MGVGDHLEKHQKCLCQRIDRQTRDYKSGKLPVIPGSCQKDGKGHSQKTSGEGSGCYREQAAAEEQNPAGSAHTCPARHPHDIRGCQRILENSLHHGSNQSKGETSECCNNAPWQTKIQKNLPPEGVIRKPAKQGAQRQMIFANRK